MDTNALCHGFTRKRKFGEARATSQKDPLWTSTSLMRNGSSAGYPAVCRVWSGLPLFNKHLGQHGN